MAQVGMGNEEILMTPLKVPEGHFIKVERVPKDHLNPTHVQHFASGPYQGIVINKSSAGEQPTKGSADTGKWFTAHVANLKDKNAPPQKERRELRFWFHPEFRPQGTKITDNFFEKLLESFPRDSIHFMIRVLSLVKDFPDILRLELEMRPMRPGETEHGSYLSATITNTTGTGKKDKKKKKKKKDKKGASQEDLTYQKDGGLGGSYENLVEGQPGYVGRGPDGAVLDSSQRRVPTQEDMLTSARVGQLGGQSGSFQQTTTTSERIDGPAVKQSSGGRGNPYHEDHLQQASERIEGPAVYPGASGGSGNPYHEAMLQRSGAQFTSQERTVHEVENMIVPDSAQMTGGRGNPYYSAELQHSVTKKTTTHHVTKTSGSRVTTTKTIVKGSVGASQEDQYLQQGVDGEFSYSQNYSTGASSSQQGSLMAAPKKKPVISMKGWDVVWAVKKFRILGTLEDAYPNILGVDDLVRITHMKKADVEYLLNNIAERGLVQQIAQGRWMRVQAAPKPKASSSRDSRDIDQDMEEPPRRKHEFKMVTHIPRLPTHEQPTVAVVTLLYCEKLAVDSMMEPKTTYVRHKTGSESQVYTVGWIGKHRVVSTKLPRIGKEQGAVIASGNTVTRLLGTFSRIEHVLLVGVGGGIPCYTDDRRHVRCGDVVVSKPEYDGGPVYIHVSSIQGSDMNVKDWGPTSDTLTKISNSLKNAQNGANSARPLAWENFMDEAMEDLSEAATGVKFNRPDNDLLYRMVEGQSMQVPHPNPAPGTLRRDGQPLLHFGSVGTGKAVVKDEEARQLFAQMNEVRALDSGFQPVMESIDGNRKESFAVIRGVADYTDGTRRQEWQPYASLAAAAVLKAMVMELPAP